MDTHKGIAKKKHVNLGGEGILVLGGCWTNTPETIHPVREANPRTGKAEMSEPKFDLENFETICRLILKTGVAGTDN